MSVKFVPAQPLLFIEMSSGISRGKILNTWYTCTCIKIILHLSLNYFSVRCRTAPMSLGTAQDITVSVARVDGSGDLPSNWDSTVHIHGKTVIIIKSLNLVKVR